MLTIFICIKYQKILLPQMIPTVLLWCKDNTYQFPPNIRRKVIVPSRCTKYRQEMAYLFGVFQNSNYSIVIYTEAINTPSNTSVNWYNRSVASHHVIWEIEILNSITKEWTKSFISADQREIYEDDLPFSIIPGNKQNKTRAFSWYLRRPTNQPSKLWQLFNHFVEGGKICNIWDAFISYSWNPF